MILRILPILLLVGTTVAHADGLPDFDRLWNYGKPAETRAKFKALLPQAEKSGDASYHLQLLTQIARTHSLVGEFEQSHAILDGVEKKLADDPKLSLARVRYLLERGRTFNSAKKQDMALPLFEKAYEIGVAAKLDFHAIDAAHMMALASPKDRKMAWSEKALALVDKTEDKRAQGWRGTLYNNIGWDYHDRKNYEKALELHLKCRAFWRERAPDSMSARIAEWSVAKQLRCLGRIDDALEIQRKLLAHYEKTKQPDGFVYEEIGECLLAQGKAEESKPYFKQAYDLLHKVRWVAEDTKRIERMKRLAGIE